MGPRLQSATKGPRLVSPKIAHALSELPLAQQQRIRSDGHSKQLFRNLVLRLAGREPLPKEVFQQVAREAANRALGLDVRQRNATIFRRAYAHFFPYNTGIRFLSRHPIHDQPLLFSSGARMQVDWIVGASLLDAPLLYIKKANGIRVIVKPTVGNSLQSQQVTNALMKIADGRDHVREVVGSIGYFGIGFHNAQDRQTKKHLPTAIIWTWQQRGIPELPNKFRKLYKNWDFELLRHVEATLKRMGMKRVGIPRGLRGASREKLERSGYGEVFLQSDDFKAHPLNPPMPFLIKQL